MASLSAFFFSIGVSVSFVLSQISARGWCNRVSSLIIVMFMYMGIHNVHVLQLRFLV